jgi:hypothetical protein
MSLPTINIDPRFCGPPDSANGGYVCGRLAAFIKGPVTVRLHAPPPLATELLLHDHPDGFQLMVGEQLIASASSELLELPVPPSPTNEAATDAARQYSGFEQHPYPGCFVCGTGRTARDGLRIFAGPLGRDGQVAAPWQPGADLGDGRGRVAPEFLWSALDCPGAFTFQPAPGMRMLLGQLTGQLLGPVAVAEPCVVLGWPLAHDGRKHTVATAIYGADGECRAMARAIWIEIP